jgi:hypothetical protein
MIDFRVVQFAYAHELLEALKSHDDSSMNLTIGSSLGYMSEKQNRGESLADTSVKLFAVYAGDVPVYV